MGNDLQTLISFCKRYKKIVCYGAGQYGYIVKEFLTLNNVAVECFLVSETTDLNNEKYGLPVYSINDQKFLTREYGIILSLSVFHYANVIKSLVDTKSSAMYLYWRI